MLTVPEAARRVGCDPETVRRWIRSGRLPAGKVGTQHVIDEAELDLALGPDSLPVPLPWRTWDDGTPQPDSVAQLRRSRRGH